MIFRNSVHGSDHVVSRELPVCPNETPVHLHTLLLIAPMVKPPGGNLPCSV